MKSINCIYNGKIYSNNGVVNNGYILVEDGIIKEISAGKPKNLPADSFDAQCRSVIPGFIDLQVNGAGGFLVMEENHPQMVEIQKALAKFGTTSFLAATSPCPDDVHLSFLEYIERCMNGNDEGATLLGVHMEGPFLNPEKAGANDPSCLSAPTKEKFLEFANRTDILKMMTISPEIGDFDEIFDLAANKGIALSIGHTTANYEQACYAIKRGCQIATHLFNTMNGILGKEPGVVMAIADAPSAVGTVICDGKHVHPSNLQLLYKVYGSDKLILITDSAPSAGTSMKEWTLEGMTILVKGYSCYTKKGSLMGSSLTMNKAAMFAKRFMWCSTNDIVKMGAENPAKAIGIFDKKGSIDIGKDADFIVLQDEESFDVTATFIGGKSISNI
jgi:N-acetylglucosamine-6-phosphate deacetylase